MHDLSLHKETHITDFEEKYQKWVKYAPILVKNII